MFQISKWSLRTKIMVIGVILPTLLVTGLFIAYYGQSNQWALQSYIEKSRAIGLTAESARQEMEDKWALDLFNAEEMNHWAQAGEMDKVLAAIPVVTAWQAAMRKAEEGGYQFKVPKFHPRNPKNKPDALEARALKTMEEKGLSEYYEVDQSINAIRYFRPVKLTQTCMNCHGDPQQSQELWGNDDGIDPTGAKMENWAVGEIHGAFEVIQSLDAADAQVAGAIKAGSAITIIGLAGMAFIFMLVITYTVNRPVRAITDTLFQGAGEVDHAATYVSQASQSLAQGASQQATQLTETATRLDELANGTKQNASFANDANSQALEARKAASQGTESMKRMSDAIKEIQNSSNQTAKIITVIEEIAFQTNLLALNAAVEAARAGEAGKGFAVVAEEVRNLAMRSAEAARNTTNMIEEAVTNADNGVSINTEVGKALDSIASGITQTTELVDKINRASQQQAIDIEQVNNALGEMDRITQENAASAEETASASSEMNNLSSLLNNTVCQLLGLVSGTEAMNQAQRQLRQQVSANRQGNHQHRTSGTSAGNRRNAKNTLPSFAEEVELV